MVALPLKHHPTRAGAPNLRKEGGGSLRNEKRAPVVLERWFGPPRPKTESLAYEEQGVGSEDYPEGVKEGSKQKDEDSDTQE